MKTLLLSSLLALGLGVTSPTTAGDVEEAVFSALERQLITEYYRDADRGRNENGNGNGNGQGRGKGKNKPLPPGIAKNLERGKPLPPGIKKTRLPSELEGKLPAPPQGHERVVVDGRVLLVDVVTGIIRDKIEDEVLD